MRIESFWMKYIVIFVLLFVICSITCEETNTRAAIISDIKDSTKKLYLSAILKTRNECDDQVGQLRRIWFYLPPTLKESLLAEVINQISRQFPRIPFETVEKLVKNFIDDTVKPQDACDFAWRILSEEVRRREQCLQKCIEDADLTPERLIRTIAKCRLEFRCYLQEIQETMMGLATCMQSCIMFKAEF